MQRPTIPNKLTVKNINVTFVVMAYRKLTDTELLDSVQLFKRSQGKLKFGATYEIDSIFGLNE